MREDRGDRVPRACRDRAVARAGCGLAVGVVERLEELADAQAVRGVPAVGAAEREDGCHSALAEADGDAGVARRGVEEEPRRRRATLAHGVLVSPLRADVCGRDPERHPGKALARDEHAARR